MTVINGFGMLGVGILALIIGGGIAFYVINKVMKEDDKEQYILTPLQRQGTLSYYDRKIHTTD